MLPLSLVRVRCIYLDFASCLLCEIFLAHMLGDIPPLYQAYNGDIIAFVLEVADNNQLLPGFLTYLNAGLAFKDHPYVIIL